MGPRNIFLFLLLFLLGTTIPLAVKILKPYLEERYPDEFNLEKIALDLEEPFPSFEVPNLTEVAKRPFHYIGHGGQAVAFASQDDQYVLKFFLKKSLHGKKKYPIPKPTHWIPSHRKARQKKREETAHRSLLKAMHNYATAFQKIKEKTGIIALHLSPTHELLPHVTLQDASGQTHIVSLDRASFVFQKKAQLVKDRWNLAKTQTERKHILAQLHQFFEERAQAGFIDIERSFMIEANYGFLGDRPIQLDVGNIEFLPELQTAPEEEIHRMQSLLTQWERNQ